MEERYPCPVCLGARMKKTLVAPGKALVVDLCPICGGVWFDRGEVLEMRNIPVDTAKRQLELSREPHFMPCHLCYVSMDRNEAECRFCHWHNELSCPVCNNELKRISCKNLNLDVCRVCGGVWFDRNELAEIWNPSFWNENPLTLLSGTDRRSGNSEWELLDGVFYLPDLSGAGSGIAAQANLAFVGGSGNWLTGAAEATAEGAGEVALHGIAEAAGGAAEVAAEAIGGAAESVADAVLEFIVELIGSALG